MNVIIIAALALLVLIVIAVIMTGRVRTFGSGVRSCKSQGGTCSDNNAPDYKCKANQAEIADTDCAHLCCIDLYTP